MGTKATLEIEGRKVDVSNLEKVFYPKVGFTKGQVIDYYIRISEALLPHGRILLL
jgi:bifunctional non-homologous end joining protein LigD